MNSVVPVIMLKDFPFFIELEPTVGNNPNVHREIILVNDNIYDNKLIIYSS